MFLLLQFSKTTQPNEVQKLSKETIGSYSKLLPSLGGSLEYKLHERFNFPIVEIVLDSLLSTQTLILAFKKDGHSVGNAQLYNNDRTQSPVVFFGILLILGF